jgi:hypothetical protein
VNSEQFYDIITALVSENCYGCVNGSNSQKDHNCLMLDLDQQFFLYFDRAVARFKYEFDTINL